MCYEYLYAFSNDVLNKHEHNECINIYYKCFLPNYICNTNYIHCTMK